MDKIIVFGKDEVSVGLVKAIVESHASRANVITLSNPDSVTAHLVDLKAIFVVISADPARTYLNVLEAVKTVSPAAKKYIVANHFDSSNMRPIERIGADYYIVSELAHDTIKRLLA